MLNFMERNDRKQTICEDDRAGNLESSQDTKNVVIFGESGVGKSSLINLIAGEKVTETSSGALGCTLEYKRHLMNLNGQHFAVWDTAGLDEGSQGSVPAEKAEAYLKQLLHELAKNNGVDLLVYCVRGTRVRSALLTNYHIFYSAICRKKVPIAIVITGLENQEGEMETWWLKNEPQFSTLKMYFDSHACVTTLDSFTETAILTERREVSKVAVVDMIISTCRTQRWKPHERSWIESAYADIRAMLAPKDGYSMRPYTLIMCETFRNCPGRRLTRKRSISFQNPVAFSAFSLNSLSFRSPISISNDSSQRKLPFQDGVKSVVDHLYHVYQVPRHQTSREDTNEETKSAMVVKRGADLLIFCVKMEETESRVVKSQWEHFNLTYGGNLSPRIVVVVGAPDQSSAQKWWQDAVGETPSKNDVDVAYCPNEAGFEVEAARKQLQLLINDRCIDCNVKVTSTKNEKLFRRSLVLDMSSLTTLWVKQENNSKDDELPSPERDILTNMGVWVEVLRSPCIPSPVSPKESQGHYSMYQPY